MQTIELSLGVLAIRSSNKRNRPPLVCTFLALVHLLFTCSMSYTSLLYRLLRSYVITRYCSNFTSPFIVTQCCLNKLLWTGDEQIWFIMQLDRDCTSEKYWSFSMCGSKDSQYNGRANQVHPASSPFVAFCVLTQGESNTSVSTGVSKLLVTAGKLQMGLYDLTAAVVR